MSEEFNLCECGYNQKPIEEQLCLHCWTLANNFPCECQQILYDNGLIPCECQEGGDHN